MKVLLRDLRNNLYYGGTAEWTQKVEHALDFGEIDSALLSAQNSGRLGLELNLILFENPNNAIRLQLDEFLRPPKHIENQTFKAK